MSPGAYCNELERYKDETNYLVLCNEMPNLNPVTSIGGTGKEGDVSGIVVMFIDEATHLFLKVLALSTLASFETKASQVVDRSP